MHTPKKTNKTKTNQKTNNKQTDKRKHKQNLQKKTNKNNAGQNKNLQLLRCIFSRLSSVAYRRVCYYTNWSQYRQSAGKFFPENVDPNLCTHIIYSFAKLVGNKLKAFEWNDESTPWMKGM